MSRYIDADALIDTFEAKKAKAHDKSMKHLYGQNKNDKLYRKDCETESRCEYVLSVLRTTPTVDAVPVVLCGKCYYKDEKRIMDEDALWCRKHHMYVTADWFCADGERKDGADDGRTD